MKPAVLPVAVALAVSSLLAASCGDDGGDKVNVVLSEFIVDPEQDSVDAGEITFVADNQGSETNELLVVEAASADELPVDADGAFDDEAFGPENVLGEVEDVESGAKKEFTLDLEPGTYVLLCNVVEETETGEVESHFAEGTHTTFTVE